MDEKSRDSRARLDHVDERILWILVDDGRASVTDIAEQVGVSKSTVTNRIQNLRRTGVLRGIHADPNWEALGLPIQALVFVRLRAQMRSHVAEYARLIIELPSVVSAFHLTGGEDFIVHLSCVSPRHLREVVETELSVHPAVASTRTQLVYDWARGDANMDHLGGWDDVRGRSPGYPSAFEDRAGR